MFPAPVEQVSPPGSKLFVDSGSLPPDERKAFSLHQPAGSWREDLVGLENVMQREADEQGPVCFKDDRAVLLGCDNSAIRTQRVLKYHSKDPTRDLRESR